MTGPGNWQTLVYFIAVPRTDGTAPSIEKAVGDTIFFTFDDAAKAMSEIDNRLYVPYAVFKAIVHVPCEAVVTAEVEQ